MDPADTSCWGYFSVQFGLHTVLSPIASNTTPLPPITPDGREEGQLVPGAASRRPGVIDGFWPKPEELVERSKGKIRADVVSPSPMTCSW